MMMIIMHDRHKESTTEHRTLQKKAAENYMQFVMCSGTNDSFHLCGTNTWSKPRHLT